MAAPGERSLGSILQWTRRLARPVGGWHHGCRPFALVLAGFGSRFRPGAGGAGSEDAVRVDVSTEAEEFVRGHGGQVWVWAAHPRVCCLGSPAYMYAATEPPADLSGFSPAHVAGLDVWYRIPGGRRPDVLEIGLRGKRRPRVEAYWDGCIYAL
jgi:hypothetical protein